MKAKKKRVRVESFKKVDKDLLVIILFTAIAIFVLIAHPMRNSTNYQLEEEAKLIEENTGILNGDVVDTEKLKELSEKDYEELKQDIGVEHDFCIRFEDINNNLIRPEGIEEDCIASPEIKASGCGVK